MTQLADQNALDELAEQEFTTFRTDSAADEPILSALVEAVGDEQRAGRLVFGDLGALFWRLLDWFPAVEAAYRYRPSTFSIKRSVSARGFPDGVKHLVDYAILSGFENGARTIAGSGSCRRYGARDPRLFVPEGPVSPVRLAGSSNSSRYRGLL